MNKKVVIWGYPPHTHTHSYIHLGFAKAFSYLDYDVVWYDDSEEYSKEDLSNAIIISENNCSRHLPIDKSSKYFIHNMKDGFYSQSKFDYDNVYNVLVYHEKYNWNDGVKNIDDYSWYHPETKTAVIMWGTDLLPDEIDSQEQILYDDTKDTVNYVGSLSGDYIEKITSVVTSNGKQFVNYGGYSGVRSRENNGFMGDDENIILTKKSYLNFDLRPSQHLDNGYIPCRIFKTLSYGCWTGTNSIKINKFFDGRITTNEDLNNLYSETEETSKNATKEVLKDNQEFIKENHTYLNRINSLLSIL
jgi:hypothetical protein